MTPHFADDVVTLHHGDCLDVLATMPDASVDAVVTDPPYGLEFMGKDWDGADGFRRSLNPADADRDSVFGRTSRTAPEYNTGRGARVRAERAGEVTPLGQGHTTSVGPYLAAGVDSVRVAGAPYQSWCEAWARECLRVLKPGGHMLAFGGTRTYHRLACAIEDAGFELRDTVAWLYGSGFPKSRNLDGDWQGWGTALKPAHEPIVVARKRLVGTVASNVALYGTGALNIDGCRTETSDDLNGGAYSGEHRRRAEYTSTDSAEGSVPMSRLNRGIGEHVPPEGRWPTNVALDVDVAAQLDAQAGTRTSGKVLPHHADNGKVAGTLGAFAGAPGRESYGDSGGASRFFPVFHYEAKAPSDERPRVGVVVHPTVKPLDLMRWLVRLITPPGGVVLDPFAGSGTTAEACIVEGFRCIAIEREADYLPLILTRINKPIEPVLFGMEAS